MIIAFIPARGGSKSVFLKNIKVFAGRPLIAWTLRSALKSAVFDNIIVSTDCSKIAETSRSTLPSVLIDERPESLALDDTPVAEVVYEYLKRKDIKSGILCLLQPTSPFLKPETICIALKCLLENNAAHSVQTVTPVGHNQHAWNQRSLNENGEVSFIFEQERSRAHNKQRKPKLYTFGNLIAVRIEGFLKTKNLFQKPSRGLVVPAIEGYDVDGIDDFVIGESLFKLFNEGKL